jgi:hypothetical protein
MSTRVGWVIGLGLIVFVLSVAGLFAIFNFIVGARSAPVSPQVSPETPVTAAIYVPCGDGTFAASEEDCERAREQTDDDDQSAPPRPSPTPRPQSNADDTLSSNTANCHAVDRGTLETNPTFTVGSITQVNYWHGGPPEYDVLVGPGTYQRADGYRGRVWEWVDCSEEQARVGVEGSWPPRRADNVQVGGWGDASFLTKLS